MKLSYSFFMLFLTSCIIFRFTPNLTDKAYTDIRETSIRLIKKHDQDTIGFMNTYDRTHNFSGSVCKRLSTINKIDTLEKIGISIRFWVDIVKTEKGSFYGKYPALGLLDKINSLKIIIEG